MFTRRQFVATTAGAVVVSGHPRVGRADVKAFSTADFEQRIARKDFKGMTKEMLPTPCLVVDLDLFNKNLKTMADYAQKVSIHLRPHVKVHKSVEVAKRQIALGAIGLTTATIAESELMSEAGIQGVLWTKQPASDNNLIRAIALTRRDPTFMFVVDDPRVVDRVQQAAEAAKVKARVAVAVFAGLKRQGIANGQPAVDLAKKIAMSKNIQLEGFMAYSGTASHTRTFAARCKQSERDLAGVNETISLARKAGLPIGIVSGGSTGTYNIDKPYGLTELECGSYVFMDSLYKAVGGQSNDQVYTDFESAMSVLVTVDSKHHRGQATTDYGNKALARPTDVVKDKPWLKVSTEGAEYGILSWENKDGDEIKVGDRFEIYCSNLDMSTNCYDRYYVAKGDEIVDVWPIMGRSGAAQR
ncbi:MAG: alanine racemase [Blastocatellia bacterium]|jgi:D-serine deaminase-like pyridoxal phosphate-dependent protein